jgi:phosphotriesterase-related protein
VIAAAKTHLRSGMVIASHTGPALPAFEEINLLMSQNVSPEAFIWVHAHVEADDSKRYKAAQMGAWVSIDGYSEKEKGKYVNWLLQFKEMGLLNKVLVSHDAGWYSPGEPYGGSFRPFTDVFLSLIPALYKNGFNEDDINQVFVKNPADAFSIKIRNI